MRKKELELYELVLLLKFTTVEDTTKERIDFYRDFIKDKGSNAIWGMQFIWPIKADYRIVYLDESYQQTIIGRMSRDYVWIMARTPKIPESDYAKLVSNVESLGYDVDLLQFASHE